MEIHFGTLIVPADTSASGRYTTEYPFQAGPWTVTTFLVDPSDYRPIEKSTVSYQEQKSALTSLQSRPSGPEPDAFERAMTAAFAIAARNEVAQHWEAGRLVPGDDDGRVVLVPPPKPSHMK